jgi:hypothetical protein
VRVHIEDDTGLSEGGYETRLERTGEIRGYGYMARGYFCSLTCGWRYALRSVDRPQRSGAEERRRLRPMIRFKVTFESPKRVFYVRANDAHEAFTTVRMIEELLERRSRGRTLDAAIIDALQSEDEDES